MLEGAQQVIVEPYTEAFKSKMVQRMAGPERRSASSLATEIGISQSTLSAWLRQAKERPVSNGSNLPKKRERRPEEWSAEEKLRAVVDAGRLSGAELGEYLRREGLHEAQLDEWRRAVLDALAGGGSAKSTTREQSRRMRQLEKQMHRKDKALAEAAALLLLQKKVRAIWGEEDESTEPESDE